MELQSIYLLQLLLVGGTVGHSWITCTDYLQENGDYWSSSRCRAYARHGYKWTPKDKMGLDTGYNYNNVPDNKACKTARDDNGAYTTDYPMAVYYPGQKVVISHPTKNHVAETCTNRYIPDSGNFVYMSGVNPVKDPTLTAFKQNLVADLGISPFGHTRTTAELTTYPKPGFQNAPKFCENMDKALATSAFYVPPHLQPGRYTFLWSWSFNSPGSGDTYTSCWEADVVATKTDRNNVLIGRGHKTSDPELLHGISLAPVPAGISKTTSANKRTPATQPPATFRPVTKPRAPATQRPVTKAPSSLTCLDSCLKTCYKP